MLRSNGNFDRCLCEILTEIKRKKLLEKSNILTKDFTQGKKNTLSWQNIRYIDRMDNKDLENRRIARRTFSLSECLQRSVIEASQFVNITTKVTMAVSVSLGLVTSSIIQISKMADKSPPKGIDVDNIKVRVIGEKRGRYDLSNLPKLKYKQKNKQGSTTVRTSDDTRLLRLQPVQSDDVHAFETADDVDNIETTIHVWLVLVKVLVMRLIHLR